LPCQTHLQTDLCELGCESLTQLRVGAPFELPVHDTGGQTVEQETRHGRHHDRAA